MKWYELAENPRAISELYNDVPSLQGVDVKEVILHRDGPRMSLKANLPRFPEPPPARWQLRGYNTAQIQLDCWVLESIQIAQWSTNNLVDIHLETTANGKILLNITSPQCSIQAIFLGFRISVSGYAREIM
jgi:hypothetical protein